MPAFNPPAEATCPECGARVPLVGQRWLHVHRVGSAEYAYPRGNSRRCPGSLMLVAPERGRGDLEASR
jgi:hypothetical protein